MKKWTNLWLSALLIACLLAFAPAALMEESAELESPVEEQTVELGGEEEFELTGEGTEVSAEAVEAEMASPEGIPVNALNFPDEAFREYVLEEVDHDGNGYLDDDETEDVRYIIISVDEDQIAPDDFSQEEYDYINGHYRDRIASLKGIEYFPNLKELHARNMPNLTELDLSKNTQVDTLYIWNDNLYELELGDNTVLERLHCETNHLGELDVSNFPHLEELFCGQNGLKELDVSHNPELVELHAWDNELGELDVSKCTALEKLWVHENELKELNVGDCARLTELCAPDNKLTSLDLSKCAKLREVDLGQNELSTVKVSSSALVELNLSNNDLKTVDVSKCTGLEELWLARNSLTQLDVSKNRKLEQLACSQSDLTHLDVSKNTELTYLYCWGSKLTSLDVSNNSKLILLNAGNTGLSSLDVSANQALEVLLINNTNIPSINVRQNPRLHTLITLYTPVTRLDISQNPLLLNLYDPEYLEESDEDYLYYLDESNADDPSELIFMKNVEIVTGDETPLFFMKASTNHTVAIGDVFRIEAGSAGEFKSSKSSVASVSADGVVEAKAQGKTNISFKVGKKKLTLKLTVKDPTIPTGLTLNVGSKIDHDYNKDLYLTCKLRPEGKAQSEIEWKTSSAKIATVTNGVVHPLKVGKVTITATAKKNKKASAKVVINIYDPKLPTGITLDKTGTVKMDLSETLTLHGSIIPATAESPIEWKSSSPKIATVKDGVVTPVKAGSVTITATPTKIKKSAKVKIVISDMHAPKSVSFKEGKNYTLKQGESITLNPVVTGETGYEPRINLTWQNGDKKGKVITFNEATHTVTAVGPGTAKITVTTDNKKKATISIKVPK